MLSRACAVACLAGLGWACAPAAPSAPVRHNVLLVTVDTLRADRLTPQTAPALDALARRGLRFTRARSVAPLTLPAHVSIMTGVLPPSHGVHLNGVPFRAAPPPLAHRLLEAGYRTAAVVGAFVLDRRFGLSDGFETYDDGVKRDPAAVDRLQADRRANVVVDRAVDWLARTQGDAPWFLWVHVYDPHAPYDAPDAPAAIGADAGAAYDAEVRYADRELARLFAAVERRVDAVRTAIIVAGDHGESLGEHGEPTHGMLLFEPALRVPLIVVAPGVAAAKRDEPVSLIDIAPTVLAWAGLPRDEAMPGADLTQPVEAERPLYAETEYPTVAGWSAAHAMVQDRWKLLRSGRDRLFDLESDPGEGQDVGASRANIVRALGSRIALVQKEASASAAPETISRETVERLQSLGYVAPRQNAAPPAGGVDAADAIDQWAAYEQALTRLQEGRSDAALETLRMLAEAHADAPLFQSTYARVLSQTGRHQRALEVYRAAVARAPGDAAMYHELSAAARAAGRHEEALRAERASLALDAAQPMAQNGLGLLLIDAGQAREAVQAFSEAVRLDPTNASYLVNLGNARRAMNDLSGAVAAYEQALDRDPDSADAANGLGVALVQLGRAAEAVPVLERAISLEPSFMEAHLNLGIALQEAGDLPRAVEQYRRVASDARPGSRERQAAAVLLKQAQAR